MICTAHPILCGW